MKDAKLLSALIYCTKCYTKHTKDMRFYIGECMHVICQTCFVNKCHICASQNFIILTDAFINKLLKNPSETHIEPVDTAMFQISSALTLINKQKTEIHKLKSYMKRCKEELNAAKSTKNDKKGMFCFDRNKNEAKNTIDKIYAKNKSIETKNRRNGSDKTAISNNEKQSIDARSHKTNYLNSITNRIGKKKLFTNYDRQNISMSSSKSMRLTVPKKDEEFKYIFRKHHDF